MKIGLLGIIPGGKERLVMFRFIIFTIALFISFDVYAGTTIYCPSTKEPIYEYKYEITSDTEFKTVDFTPTDPNGWQINMFRPINYKNGVPLDGYDYWFWSRGRPLPKKNFTTYTFLIKDNNGNFVWMPYKVDLEE